MRFLTTKNSDAASFNIGVSPGFLPCTTQLSFWGQSAFKKKFTDHFFRVSGSCGRFLLGGGFKYFLFSSLLWGRFPIWLIFFRWVGSTTHQFGRFLPFFRGTFFWNPKSKSGGSRRLEGYWFPRRSHTQGGGQDGRVWVMNQNLLPPQKTDIWQIEKNNQLKMYPPMKNHDDFPAIVMLVNSGEDSCSIL